MQGPKDTTSLHAVTQQSRSIVYQRPSVQSPWKPLSEVPQDESSDVAFYSAWQRRLADDLMQYDNENDLENTGLARVWGMATSPGNKSIAVVYTLHPGDMVEYVLASQEESKIAFGGYERTSAQTSPSKPEWTQIEHGRSLFLVIPKKDCRANHAMCRRRDEH